MDVDNINVPNDLPVIETLSAHGRTRRFVRYIEIIDEKGEPILCVSIRTCYEMIGNGGGFGYRYMLTTLP